MPKRVSMTIMNVFVPRTARVKIVHCATLAIRSGIGVGGMGPREIARVPLLSQSLQQAVALIK